MINPSADREAEPLRSPDDDSSSHRNPKGAHYQVSPIPPRPKPDGDQRVPRPARERLDPCRVRPATPYLIIRSWPDDLGVRPIPVIDATGLYFSPDIGVGIHTPLVEAWITNGGLAPATPVQVELYRGSPSLSYPAPDLALLATEYTIIQPLSSARVLFDLQPFPFSVLGSIVVRCSTPFDRCSNSFDPLIDRHVAIQNLGVPAPGDGNEPTPPFDIKIPNWYTTATTSSVEMVIERLQVTRDYYRARPEAKVRDLRDDLLRFGETTPSIEQHLDLLSTQRRISAKSMRKLRRTVRTRPMDSQFPSGLRRSQVAPVPSQIQIEIEVKSDSRRLYPTAASLRPQLELFPGAGAQTLSRLPAHRQILIESLNMRRLEEREIRVQFGGFGKLRADEFVIVHLYHVNCNPRNLLGRFSFIVAPEGARALTESR